MTKVNNIKLPILCERDPIQKVKITQGSEYKFWELSLVNHCLQNVLMPLLRKEEWTFYHFYLVHKQWLDINNYMWLEAGEVCL